MKKDPFMIENASCNCPVGASEGCGHVIGLLYQLAKFKMLDVRCVPEDVAKTSLPCTWSIPRGEQIAGKAVQSVQVMSYKQHPDESEEPPKPIKSTLYNPIRCDIPSPILLYDPLRGALPNSMMLDFLTPQVQDDQPQIATEYGDIPRGSIISYQQTISSEYLINNYADTNFPILPVNDYMINNLSIALTKDQSLLLADLLLSEDDVSRFEEQTRIQSASKLWHKLRKGRITASNVGAVVKRRKEDVTKFIGQLTSTRNVQTQAMKKGLAREPMAAMKYSDTCNQVVNVYPCGIVISVVSPWLAASPDRKVYHQGGFCMCIWTS